MGQISQMQAFSEPNLYIQYQLFLPEGGWTCDPNTKQSGYTQITMCEFNWESNMYIGRVSMPLELAFHTTLEPTQLKPPKLYFKVWSLDSLERQLVQGYGCLVLPTIPGPREITIPTWKPRAHFQSNLKSFFLGGSPDLIDLNFNELEGIESNNHYGFKTKSSGSVSFSINCISRARYSLNLQKS